MAAAIDPDDALWSAEPDAFDDFDRGDQGSLGSTPVGAYPWALRAGRRPRIVERVLMPRGGDLLESQAFVGELEVADLLLSLAVRTTRPEAVWTVSYRSNEEGGYRIEGSADSVALFLGEQRIAHASVELPVDAWSQVQLVVEGAVHHVMIDGRSVLEAEDHQRLSAGFIGLGGSNGVELDDLWILSTAHDGEATGGTSGGGLGGGSRGPLRMRDDGAMEMTAGQGPGGELDGGNEPGVVSVPQQPAAVGEAGEGPMLEPLRLAGAPAQDLTVPTTLYKQVQFLFEGPGAEQQGVDFAALSPARIALIHGWVRDTMGQPLEDVEVWSLGHPELGTTATRADGSYDLVVGGGIDHSIVLTHPGYLSVQRHVVTRAGESQRADDAVLIEVDSESSFITFSNPIEVHHATTPEDDAPARMATVMFRGGTLATMVFEDGSTAPLPEMTVRLTEYTAGAEGLEQMPAEIAPGTAYNYAIEISADEAEAVGAASVELDQPAVLYVDDFTEWGVGTVVPSGAFDRGEGRWHGEPDGLVIEVLWLDGIGRAEIDLTGDGIEATPEELLALGFSDDERIELGSIYADGSQLWRTPIHHFTPFDLNPAAAANGEPPPDGLGPDENGDIDGCEGNGSIIGLDNQDLGERLPVAGTPFSLEYRSSRTRGAPNRGMRVQVTGDEIPENLVSAFAWASIAGRTVIADSLPMPNAHVDLQWDGLDAYGRPVQGPQPIDLCVGWEFPFTTIIIDPYDDGVGGTGEDSASAVRSFGVQLGEFGVHVPGRGSRNATLVKCYGNGKAVAAAAMDSISEADKFRLGGLDAQTISDGLGGWTLDVHHTLARATSTLYRGDGSERELADEAMWTATRFAGNRETTQGLLEGPARGAFFHQPSAVTTDPAGNLYVATPGLVRRVDADGDAVIVAGTPTPSLTGVFVVGNHVITGFAGDGGPATDAMLSNSITSLAYDGRGGLYIADAGNARVRYVNPDGIISTVAGSGVADAAQLYQGVTPTGGDPLEVSLIGLTDIWATRDGDGLLIAQGFGNDGVIRLLTSDGVLLHIAGDPAPPYLVPWNERPWANCGGACGNPAGEIRSAFPWDTIPGLATYLDPHLHRAEWASFDAIQGITTRGDSIYVGEGDRIRRIDGLRGGNIFGFRKDYVISEPLPCGGSHCTYPVQTDLPPGVLVRDLIGDGNGIFYTTTDLELFLAQDDLEIPRERIIGGPQADVWMQGDDDVLLANRLQMSAYTAIARGPDGAIYVADRTRNLVYRIAKTVPPMYAASSVTSRDGAELYLFDDEGRHLETRDALTNLLRWSFEYDSQGLLTAVVDQFGDTTTIHRDVSGTATSIESADGHITTLSYGPSGYLTSTTDPTGSTESFVYGDTGLMQSMSDSDSLSTFQYDVRGRLTNDDSVLTYGDELETLPQVLERTQSTQTMVEVTHTSATGAQTRYQRERTGASSLDRTIEWPDGTVNSSQWSPRLESVTTPDGTTVVTRYGLDERLGINTRVPASYAIEIPGVPTATANFGRSYSPHCTVFAEGCDPGADPDLQADEVIETVSVGGHTWTETYQRAHVEAGATVPATTTVTTPLGRETVTTLDPNGLPVSVSIAGIAPLTYAYDPRGRIESISRSDGATTRSTTIAYDAEGFVQSLTDALGQTSYQYDDVGRVLQQTFADGRVVTFAYDDDGNLTSVTPPSRPAHVFDHDSLDRIRSYQPPATPAVPTPQTVLAYNGAHQPTTVTRPDGQALQMSYDPVNGRLAEIVTPIGSYVYGYDAATGQVDSVVDPEGGSLAYAYSGPLVTSETLAGTVAGSVSWSYDARLRVQSISVNGAHSVAIDYDADGAPSSVGDLEIGTDPLNGDLVWTDLEGLGSTHAANGYGEPSEMSFERGGSTLYELELVRDEVGRIESKIEERNGVTSLRCYEYDLGGRLTEVYDGADALGCTGNVLEHYGYDDNGNRIEVANDTVNLGPSEIGVDEQDRLLRYGDVGYTYTANGEVATYDDDGQVTTFDHDAEGLLRHVILPDGTQLDYTYDARGRRVGKSVDGVLVQGLLYGDQVFPVAQLDGAGAVQWRMVYATRSNVPDYLVDGDTGELYRVIADQLGSVVMVVSAKTGLVAQELSYDSWGRVLSDSNPGFQPLGFAGGVIDAHTGWVHFGARDYRPEVGAWSSKDPLGFAAGDTNLFAYVGGDPVNRFDPWGLAWYDTVANASAGFGDTISLGLTRHAREKLGVDDVVDYCSKAHRYGEYAGYAHLIVTTGAGAMRGLGYEVAFSRYPTGGGGVNLLKAGKRRFAIDWHKFKMDGKWANRPHWHHGITKGQMKKHRPWQKPGGGGWRFPWE